MSTPQPDSSFSVTPRSQIPAPRAVGSGARVADTIVSVVLIIAGVLGFAMLAFMSLFLVMMSDGCFGDRCNTGLMSAGWLIALAVPPVIFIAAVGCTIIRLARRKTAWWVPLAGAGVSAVIWFVGFGIMNASLGR
ncbi:DUF6264 family protein [Microbacterium laevaniformans]|uniref:DUF6264 family protein n=1 Tax=Microbacterium laevaniformans TaxID=36807 RepID=UPI003629EB71